MMHRVRTIEDMKALSPNHYRHLTSEQEHFARQADVWADLIDAYRGVAAKGSTVVEIYASRLDYGAHMMVPSTHNRDFARALAKRFIDLIKLFCSAYACEAFILEIPADYSHPIMEEGFYWRAEVEIRKPA